MAYLGVPPQSGFISNAKERYTGITTAYVDLNHSISSLADVIVWVNYVKQDATNLTLTSSTRITLGATLVSADIVEVAYLGKAVSTQAPATGQVTNDMLAGSIANSKLANSSITLNGSAVSLGGSATVGGDNTPAFSVKRHNATQSISSATNTKVQFNTEVFDTDNAYDSSTNYRFTVPSGKSGKYFFNAKISASGGNANLNRASVMLFKNGSLDNKIFIGFETNPIRTFSSQISAVMDLAVSDYVEVFAYYETANGNSLNIDDGAEGLVQFYGYKLIT